MSKQRVFVGRGGAKVFIEVEFETVAEAEKLQQRLVDGKPVRICLAKAECLGPDYRMPVSDPHDENSGRFGKLSPLGENARRMAENALPKLRD